MKYTYDGLDVVMEETETGVITTDGGVITKYENGLGVDNKLEMATGGTAKYFLQDHLGSTIGLTDASGNVTEQTSYDSFGNATNNLSTRYQYTGREYDEFTGLYYYRARWYDAQLGRFISEDPIGLNGGINQFGYVGNNAPNLADPNGLDGCRKLPNGRCEPPPQIPTGGEPPRQPPHFISDPPPSPTPSSTPFPPMGGDPPSASGSPCDCETAIPRFPDFYTWNIGASLRQLPFAGNFLPSQFGVGLSVTVDRYYGLYGGPHYGFNFPKTYEGNNITAGYMLTRCKPKQEELSGFLSEKGTSVGGFGPIPGFVGVGNLGGYYTWNDNGSAISLGIADGPGFGGSTGWNWGPKYFY